MGLAGAGVTVMAMSALTVLFGEKDLPKAVGIYEAANFAGLPARSRTPAPPGPGRRPPRDRDRRPA